MRFVHKVCVWVCVFVSSCVCVCALFEVFVCALFGLRCVCLYVCTALRELCLCVCTLYPRCVYWVRNSWQESCSLTAGLWRGHGHVVLGSLSGHRSLSILFSCCQNSQVPIDRSQLCISSASPHKAKQGEHQCVKSTYQKASSLRRVFI